MTKLKELRKTYNKTLKDVAMDFETSPQVISRYELGQAEPDFNTLIKLADYFNVTVDYLLGRTAHTQPTISPHFLTLYNSLTPIQQEKVIAFMEGLLA